MKPRLIILLCGFLLAGCRSESGVSPIKFPQAEVTVKGRTLRVEVAWTPELRFHGFRFRRSVPEGTGMIFLFPEPSYLAFVMTDTPVPLSIAFARRDGTIFQIERMKPFDTSRYHSVGQAQVALEVPQGWFEANGVGVGDRIEGLNELFAQFPPKQ